MIPTLLPSSLESRLNSPTVHRLPNGLTIVAEQMPVEAVNLSLWLGIGSAIESDAINGMAHFLEHMIFKGTQRLQLGEFERSIEQRGAVTNAATSQDYTHYYITTAPHDFAELAPLQIEVALNAAIPDEEFERERSVILEEIRRANDNPRRRTFYRSMEMAFDRLPYRRPVLGLSEVVENLTAQQMRDFHATWYKPQSMTAVAVGNLPVEQLINIVAESFETAEAHRPMRSDAQLPELLHHELEQPFDRIVRQEYIDESLQQARIVMTWRVPGMADVAQTYALDALASILGQGRTARLVRELREDQQLVTGISVSNMTYTTQGVFYIVAQLPLENVPVVEAAIARHIQQLQTEPVTTTEIERVRTLVANRYIFGNETPSDRAGLYGYYHAVMGDLEPALNYPAYIQSLNPLDLQEAAQRYLSPDAYGILVMKPA
ncbi:insulinase family protein [Oscillatoria sp. FACHB-1407]|uniref:M16 family metallopeptidase n=1 Tax=Oscillatoria sp. FACHB-1407 TaxID=2692847 RepID=UPI0016824721|nr:pitrilysin family protein [Oscillatoria sp. FACHB-1407]MBD2460486.1 insulinase family protein [Oscillatoria sp. FACHB-1407]